MQDTMRAALALALLVLVGCANEAVLSVPACECRPHPLTGAETCVADCGPNGLVCELDDGTLCLGSFQRCGEQGYVPRCVDADLAETGSVVCVSLELARTLASCE